LYSALHDKHHFKALRHGSHSFTCNKHHACLTLVALLVDLRLIGRWFKSCSGLGQATYACVPLSPSSIIWYRRKPGSKQARRTIH